MGQYEYLTSGSQSFEKRQDPFNYSPHIGVAFKITDRRWRAAISECSSRL